MTKIKLCGLMSPGDVETANELMPEYVGFIFAKESRRYVSPRQAAVLKRMLHPDIKAVGVFVNEDIRIIEALLTDNVIDAVQLHGGEDEAYIGRLREAAGIPIIKAFRIDSRQDVVRAEESTADHVLLDAGSGGTGTSFDWNLISGIERPYFLAGGLDAVTVKEAVESLQPYGVDVSSGIETDGHKDPVKMRDFVAAVRGLCGHSAHGF